MDSRQFGIALASILATCAGVVSAAVGLPGATLAVHNPTGLADCVSEGELQARILSQLSLGVISRTQARNRHFDVTIVEEAGEWVAELRMSGQASGMRRIQALRCQGLEEALAVTLAMILDSDDEPPDPAPPNAPSLSSLPPPAVQRQRSLRPKALPPISRVGITRGTVALRPKPTASAKPLGIRIQDHEPIRAWIGGGWGTLGSGHLETGLGLSLRHWAMAVGAFWDPTREVAMSPVNVRVMALGGFAAGCWHTNAHWRTLLCLRGAVGAERVAGVGAGATQPRILPVVYLGPSIGVETGSRWVFGLDLIGLGSPWRDAYVVENSQSNQQKELAPLVTAWLVARVALTSSASQD